jgi:hypothetical protein
MTWAPVSVEAGRTGFISTRGIAACLGLQGLSSADLAAVGVAAEFNDMFCALKGDPITFVGEDPPQPCSENRFSTWEAVPRIIKASFGLSSPRCSCFQIGPRFAACFVALSMSGDAQGAKIQPFDQIAVFDEISFSGNVGAIAVHLEVPARSLAKSFLIPAISSTK